MRFTKMHGAGNDYVYVDCFKERVPEDLPALAIAVSDRHTGVGSDGLILIHPSEVADARMQMFNADGSEAEMCGNGIRCVAKYLYDRGMVGADEFTIETAERFVHVAVTTASQSGQVASVRVNMGLPSLRSQDIPTRLPGDPPRNAVLSLTDLAPGMSGENLTGNGEFEVTCVSMGNPHCVMFVEELSDGLIRRAGPVIEVHPHFPQRVNVEFVRIDSPHAFRMRVWERGAGETQACGSGACAVMVAGVITGRLRDRATATLSGGELQLEWDGGGDVFLTGPAVEVFSGEWPVD